MGGWEGLGWERVGLGRAMGGDWEWDRDRRGDGGWNTGRNLRIDM